jgi:hypothetical protein
LKRREQPKIQRFVEASQLLVRNLEKLMVYCSKKVAPASGKERRAKKKDYLV